MDVGLATALDGDFIISVGSLPGGEHFCYRRLRVPQPPGSAGRFGGLANAQDAGAESFADVGG